MPVTIDDAGGFLADVRALEAAGAEMIGIDGDSPQQWVLLGAIAATTERIRLHTDASQPDSLRILSRGRAVSGPLSDESWVEVAMPADRSAWTAMLSDAETAGAAGVIVSWDPRLIDLLRNPEPDDRSDLLMSTG
jgi:hypothetical protein